MKKRYFILSVLTLVMLFVLGNNAYAATVNTDLVSFKLPSRFDNDYAYISDSEDKEYVWRTYYDYGDDYDCNIQFHIDAFGGHTPSKYRVEYTQSDVDSQAKYIDEYEYDTDYNTYDYSVLSKSLVKISGVNVIKIRYKYVRTSKTDSEDKYVCYYESYYIRTDRVEYEIYCASLTEDYLNSTEWKNCVKSIVIKDTVAETRVTPFTDVQTTSWYYNAVKYCYANNIINGTNDYTFAPNTKLTRGMLVAILYKMEGSPKVTGTNKFTDVKSGKYYYNAVVWASNNGIVSGYKGTTKFGPNDNITRQDLAGMLSNYANYKGKYVKSNKSLASFTDSSKVSKYALPAMRWAVNNNIINGSNGKLNPKGNATRAEAAAMVYNYCLNIK